MCQPLNRQCLTGAEAYWHTSKPQAGAACDADGAYNQWFPSMTTNAAALATAPQLVFRALVFTVPVRGTLSTAVHKEALRHRKPLLCAALRI